MRFEDGQLVSRCLSGDTEAFGKLVTRYQAAVYATAYFYVQRAQPAEDIAQEAFIAAYRNLPRLRDPGSFGPWLKEITCRTAANWLRKHGRRLDMETPLPRKRAQALEDAREGPEGKVLRAERLTRVQQAIEALPERYRLPVVLRYLQELNYEEIGDFTGESPGEIRGVLQRAGKQLRELLSDLSSENTEETGQWPRAHE
jgi:RNA polymerase sigma-70 factor, ECF subfamily